MRILVVNPFGIGDVLFSTPLISNLKAACPKSYVGYICNMRARGVLSDNQQINAIFIFEKDYYRKLWKSSKIECIKKFIEFLMQIKSKKFDCVIDLSLGHQYSFFLWLLGIKRRIGYNYKGRGRFLTDKIDITGYEDKPIADYYLDLLKFLDIQPQQFNLTMSVADAEKKWAAEFLKSSGLNKTDLIIGIIPAGGASWGKDFAFRHWAWENYAQLADKLVAQLKAKIIIFADTNEQNICQRIQGIMKEPAVSACGKTSFKQFAALLAKCKIVVCNDGGPLHVAVSQNVLTVSIFGPVDEKVYGPYPPGRGHIVVTKDMPCRPCYHKFRLSQCRRNRECVRSISADEVLKLIKENLQLGEEKS